ncbi:MAG: hypothetical protein JXR49_07410 [Acidobacteria bacterium]|nr:hypothetical protein [Acidobacteriota bacterium]
MAKIYQNGLPDNWAEMTREQKRGYRLNQYLNPPGIEFVSPEAEEAYKVRAQRMVDAYNVEEPDRVPVHLPIGNLPFNLAGLRMYDAMHDVEKAIRACKDFNEKYAEELETLAYPFALPGKVLEILDYKLYAIPGHGLSRDAPGHQFKEGEYMKVEEYEDLIMDPSNFWLRTYLPRVYGAFESFRNLVPLTDMLEIPMGEIMPLALPEVQDTLQRLLDAGKELQRRNEISARLMDFGPGLGFPSMAARYAFAPFDAVGDTLRGTRGVVTDMFRNRGKLEKAVEVMADVTIDSLLRAPSFPTLNTVMFPLHKGADGWMSEEQYENLYWPSLKRVMDALIEEGIIPVMFAEGGYETRLKSVMDFPKGSVVWWFDQTNMAKAKEVLGGKFCIQGNVPSSLICTGSPEQVKEYCRKLIEDCGKGGGYVLGAGCIPDDPKLECVRAMMAAAKEFGVYGK